MFARWETFQQQHHINNKRNVQVKGLKANRNKEEEPE